MAKCKEDCIHFHVCERWCLAMDAEQCEDFKDKEKWAEQKHGRWDKNHPNDNIVYCDLCYMPQDMPTPFCHSCGAKMEV